MGRNEEQGPEAVATNNPNPNNSKGDGTDLLVRKPGSKGHGRKRTKSGCLTCRRRRIKCGEERPTCQNCIKSKRHCEGYNQRVVFKDPLNAYRPSLSTPSQVSVSFTPPILGQRPGRPGKQEQQATSGSSSHSIAPKPRSQFDASHRGSDATSVTSLLPTSPGSERRPYSFFDSNPGEPSNNQDTFSKPQTSFDTGPDVIDQPRLPEPQHFRAPKEQATHYDFNALMKTDNGEQAPYPPAQISPLSWSAGPSPTYYQSYPTATWIPPNVPFAMGDVYTPRHQSEPGRILGVVDSPEEHQADQNRNQQESQPTVPTYIPKEENRDPGFSTTLQGQQITPRVEREYYFPESDDDAGMDEYGGDEIWQQQAQDDHLKRNDLGIVVALQANQDNQGLGLRSFTSFIDHPNILATYLPSSQATPMQDRMTAMIFCHFVNVTGPSMSIFERHPANPSLMFQGTPVPRSQQHIWAYTFPTLALQNPALLHAMLALGSLHIAKLQGGPITASLKHYAIGLRRVAKSVSLPTRRGHPATLAAAMLLAFYECWSADHQKWSNHLLGAKQLVGEIDFIGMTKFIKWRRAHQLQEEHERHRKAHNDRVNSSDHYNERYSTPIVDEVDENLVGMLMGRKVKYDEFGQIVDEFVSDPEWRRNYTEKDLEIYETQRDLFWWYCKQDVYQAILGAAKLFMDYSYWSHCPPRAPLGRLNAVYGTFDHLILLMGRLADFAARDLKRKRAAIKANGGWRPPASMFPQNQSGAFTSPQMPTSMPNFSGMVPGVKEAQLPMGFEAPRDASPQSAHSEDSDLHSRTIEAEEEWQEIRAAFTLLEDHFGEDFQALGPEFSAPIETPFGTALQYRTYGIAGIWMNFYMGVISCHRSHPSMPPASMVAAGVMRKKTEYYANQLGRIAAGIAPDCSMSTQVNPGVGAVLIESSTCLFVSAIQYHDPHQRAWTIRRLRHIARLTGWQTALAIASGCQASWTKTYEAGKGPAYVRPSDGAEDSMLHGNGVLRQDVTPMQRRIDRAFEGKSNEERRQELERPDRVHYALGVLGLEEDFQELDVNGRRVDGR